MSNLGAINLTVIVSLRLWYRWRFSCNSNLWWIGGVFRWIPMDGSSKVSVDREPTDKSSRIVPTESELVQLTWDIFSNRFFDRIGGNRYGMCGGFLIDSRHVMTAAHCIMDSNTKLRKIGATEVYLGIHDLTKLNTPHKVEKFFYPKDYNQHDLYNDIAVLRLTHPVNFTNKIRPICLPKSDDEPYKRLVVAGFGKLGANRDPSEVLMHVSVEYIPSKNTFSPSMLIILYLISSFSSSSTEMQRNG